MFSKVILTTEVERDLMDVPFESIEIFNRWIKSVEKTGLPQTRALPEFRDDIINRKKKIYRMRLAGSYRLYYGYRKDKDAFGEVEVVEVIAISDGAVLEKMAWAAWYFSGLYAFFSFWGTFFSYAKDFFKSIFHRQFKEAYRNFLSLLYCVIFFIVAVLLMYYIWTR